MSTFLSLRTDFHIAKKKKHQTSKDLIVIWNIYSSEDFSAAPF